MIESTIDLSQIENHLFLIQSSFDPELGELKKKLDKIEKIIDDLAEKAAKKLGLASKSVKRESNAKDGCYFRISRKVEKFSAQDHYYFSSHENMKT